MHCLVCPRPSPNSLFCGEVCKKEYFRKLGQSLCINDEFIEINGDWGLSQNFNIEEPVPNFILKGLQFNQLRKNQQYNDVRSPIIYCWKRNNSFLYVGQSSFGFRRFITHKVMERGSILDDDEILFFIIEDSDFLTPWENFFIRKFKPTLNKALPKRK